MAIEVRIPTILRTYTDGAKQVEGDGSTSCRPWPAVAFSKIIFPNGPGLCATTTCSTPSAIRR
jgi:hypothetical protein